MAEEEKSQYGVRPPQRISQLFCTTVHNPVKDMKVIIQDEDINVTYRGEGDGLLLHQAHLADKLIDSCLKVHESAQ